MTPQEAAALLGVAAAFDGRKPNPEAATAWAAALGDTRFTDARDAIVTHYQAGSDWVMPGHVLTEVRHVRSKRIAEAGPLTPPPDLDPIETNAWLLEARRRVADGEPVDQVDHPYRLTQRNLPELRALIARRPAKPAPAPLLTEADLSREPTPTEETR